MRLPTAGWLPCHHVQDVQHEVVVVAAAVAVDADAVVGILLRHLTSYHCPDLD